MYNNHIPLLPLRYTSTFLLEYIKMHLSSRIFQSSLWHISAVPLRACNTCRVLWSSLSLARSHLFTIKTWDLIGMGRGWSGSKTMNNGIYIYIIYIIYIYIALYYIYCIPRIPVIFPKYIHIKRCLMVIV